VYSTTEPLEALLFGGNTATLHEGKVVQFGPTNEVYQYPNNLTSAQVFSEPIMNQVKVIKKGSELLMHSGAKWQLKGKAANLDDGGYTFGIRPHHFKIKAKNDGFIRILGKVDISEISGSDSVIHFNNDDGFWIVHLSGMHSHSFGSSIELYMDTTKGILFDDNGNTVLNSREGCYGD
jgi:glycerol transport system ATP-binding protein